MSTIDISTEPLGDAHTQSVEGATAAGRLMRLGSDPDDRRWQERLLPLMSRTIVALAVFFFTASLAQLFYLDRAIERVPESDYSKLGIAATTDTQALPSAEFRIRARLEANILDRRYHQANVFLMGRLWTSYLGFVTGMILALVGAVFILGKLRTDASELGAHGAGLAVSLRSASPGLVLATLGVVLMITTIVIHHPIQTAESPVFIGAANQKPDISRIPPP